jgi:hypothetical protein
MQTTGNCRKLCDGVFIVQCSSPMITGMIQSKSLNFLDMKSGKHVMCVKYWCENFLEMKYFESLNLEERKLLSQLCKVWFLTIYCNIFLVLISLDAITNSWNQ